MRKRPREESSELKPGIGRAAREADQRNLDGALRQYVKQRAGLHDDYGKFAAIRLSCPGAGGASSQAVSRSWPKSHGRTFFDS